METGLIHLYTGEGKGKTSAAAGLAVRAAGTGLKVLFVQFMKGRSSGELESFGHLPQIRVLRSDRDFGFSWNMTEQQKEELHKVHDAILEQVTAAVGSGACDVLILDEITYPVTGGLIDEEKLRALIVNKPEPMELVLTGRNAPDYMREHADYITEMRCVRHPYEKGIAAREGIEF